MQLRMPRVSEGIFSRRLSVGGISKGGVSSLDAPELFPGGRPRGHYFLKDESVNLLATLQGTGDAHMFRKTSFYFIPFIVI